MNKALRDQVMSLPAKDKVELAMELWDSIDEGELPLPTDEQLAEAERRFAAFQKDPSRGSPVDVAMKRIRARFE
ncbi:MAG: putative addiction module component [Alphaproteobacteria bacterium]|jgi:putative addiction module component (TIGR02574 family)|nr:putative addiction module component [Alphaproteobacteria bacterium]